MYFIPVMDSNQMDVGQAISTEGTGPVQPLDGLRNPSRPELCPLAMRRLLKQLRDQSRRLASIALIV